MAIRTKWDGFLCLVFRDRERIDLQSESKQPLTCYFPEIREAVAGIAAEYFVPDGELAVPSRGALMQRIHPAPSRVAKLSMQTPAILIVFDLMAGSGGKSLLQTPLWKRRQHLEEFAHTFLRRDKRFRLLPSPSMSQQLEVGWPR